jgi:hypothetical protein
MGQLPLPLPPTPRARPRVTNWRLSPSILSQSHKSLGLAVAASATARPTRRRDGAPGVQRRTAVFRHRHRHRPRPQQRRLVRGRRSGRDALALQEGYVPFRSSAPPPALLALPQRPFLTGRCLMPSVCSLRCLGSAAAARARASSPRRLAGGSGACRSLYISVGIANCRSKMHIQHSIRNGARACAAWWRCVALSRTSAPVIPAPRPRCPRLAPERRPPPRRRSLRPRKHRPRRRRPLRQMP